MTSSASSQQAGARPVGALEISFVVLALLFVTDALSPLLFAVSHEHYNTDSNVVRLVAATSIYATALLIAAFGARGALSGLLHPAMLLVALLPLLSCFWSAEPAATLRRGAAGLLTVVFSLYLAYRFEPTALLRLFLLASLIGGLVSFALALVDPAQAVEAGGPNAGSWFGVYGHKANLGRVGALAITGALLLDSASARDRFLKAAVIGVFAVLLVLSQSRTGWILALCGLAAAGLIRLAFSARLSPALKLSLVLFCVVAGAAILDALLNSEALAIIGRDSTLSGRTTLWRAALASFEQHPMLGVGYRAFWRATGINDVLSYLPDRLLPGHGHNGYLDTLAELGLVGIGALGAFLVTAFSGVVRAICSPAANGALGAYFAFLLIFAMNNYVATVAFEHSDPAWVLALVSAAYFTANARGQPGTRQRNQERGRDRLI